MVAFELGNITSCKEAEYIFLDFVDARLHFQEIKLKNGEMIRLTESNFSKPLEEEIKKNIGEIDTIKSVDPINFSENEIEKEIKAFAEALIEDYPDKKIIVLENQHVLTYVSKDNQLKLVPNYSKLSKENSFFSVCYQKAHKYLNAIFLPFPKGMITVDYQNIWSYPESYYEYIFRSLEALNKGEMEQIERLKIQKKDMIWEIRRLWLKQTQEGLLESYAGRKIVMPKSEVMMSEFFDVVDTLDIITLENEEIVKIFSEKNNKCEYFNRKKVFWFIPFDRIEENLLNLLWKCGFVPKEDYLCQVHEPINLRNFCGIYEDCFNNKVECQDSVNLCIYGSENKINLHQMMVPIKLSITLYNANTIYLDDKNKTLSDGAKGMRIICGDNSSVIIGKNNTLGIDLTIDGGNFSDIIMGDEILISKDVLIKNTLCEKIAWQRKLELFTRSKIIIGNHVWLGLRANIFSDTNIGNDSVVGARSVLKKHFSSNSIIVGNYPNDRALDKKPPITWSRMLNGKKLEK